MRRTPDDVREVRSHERVAHWAAADPDRPALGYAGRWMTYAEWHERSRRRAGSLRGDVSPVALLYDVADVTEFAVSYVAAHAAGRPALVLNPKVPAHDLRRQIDFAGAGTVLGSAGRTVRPAAAPRGEPLLDRWGHPMAEISFSSGTTGEPKGILLSHWALAWAAVMATQLAFAGRVSFDQPGEPIGGHDTIVSAFPAGSAATTNGLLNVGLDAGARMHVLPKFDAATFGEFMRSVQGTVFYGAPAHLALWRQAEPDAVPSARTYVVIGQSPAGVDVDWFLARPGGARLVNAYALTETCAGMTVAIDSDAHGAGRPLDGVEIRLVDADGRDVEREGELVMRSFGMMEGYLDRPDLTAERVRDGWVHTGDVVERRGDAYVIRGRVGDRINRGGYKFDPFDVEDVAARVPGVTGAVACAIPHPVLGEDVGLAVEVVAGHDPEAVREAVATALGAALPSFKIPRDVRVVAKIPRGGLDKPSRTAVAAWFTEDDADEVKEKV
ncbi:long-chain fatty acid--CoA ligase [Pseudonocardia kongjuensis]|uniref:Long-chain fatty acid--CoA ligase n=1 Tax=Pseudonocardia kongjuensis TaxID=102227 RepID=A0ABN1Y178_9PSEU